MTWHSTTSLIDRYLSGTADASEAMSLEAHLPECERCRELLTRRSDRERLAANWAAIEAHLGVLPSGAAAGEVVVMPDGKQTEEREDAVRVPVPPRRRWRPAVVTVAAFAAAAVLGLAGILVARSLGDGSSDVADQPTTTTANPTTAPQAVTTTTEATTTTATTTTTTIPPMPSSLGMTWTQISTQEAFGFNDFLWEVAPGGPGLVAVGGVSEEEGDLSFTDGAVWVSSDGLEWQRVGSPDVFDGVSTQFGTNMNQVLDDVAVGPAGIVVTGWVDTDTGDLAPPVWFSPDGLTWSRLSADDWPDGPQFAPGGPVFATDDGFLTVRVGDDMWASTDGLEWTFVADAGVGVAEAVDVAGTARGGPGFVTVGTVTTDSCGPNACNGYPVAFLSPDGRTWSEVSIHQPPPETPVAYIYSLATSGDTLIAAGEDLDGHALWTSTDGITWTRSGTVAAPDRAVFLWDALITDDGRMLAAGAEFFGGVPLGAAVVFGSADGGDTWYEILNLSSSEEGPYDGTNDQSAPGIRDLIEIDGTILAVGGTGNSSAPVWIGTWDGE